VSLVDAPLHASTAPSTRPRAPAHSRFTSRCAIWGNTRNANWSLASGVRRSQVCCIEGRFLEQSRSTLSCDDR
jgi:hypothetical protein